VHPRELKEADGCSSFSFSISTKVATVSVLSFTIITILSDVRTFSLSHHVALILTRVEIRKDSSDKIIIS
jgi:hypothetical protein